MTDDILPRVAVVGVPRGGTSATVGLLRILGLRLPGVMWKPSCFHGEATALRWADNSLRLSPAGIVESLAKLPAGTVWKDPAVAAYAQMVPWENWRVVRICRDTNLVAESERRWMGQLTRKRRSGEDLAARAHSWEKILDEVIPGKQVAIELDFEQVRADPRSAMDDMALSLSLPGPSPEQRAMAAWFVTLSGGYRCPLPGRCETGPAGH